MDGMQLALYIVWNYLHITSPLVELYLIPNIIHKAVKQQPLDIFFLCAE